MCLEDRCHHHRYVVPLHDGGVFPNEAREPVLGEHVGPLAHRGGKRFGIAGVLASLYPAVTVLLAAGLLKERIAPAQWAGIGICTAAVAAIALG